MFESYTEIETITKQELKDKYDKAKQKGMKSKQILYDLRKEYFDIEEEIKKHIFDLRQCLNRLNPIAFYVAQRRRPLRVAAKDCWMNWKKKNSSWKSLAGILMS